MDQNYVYATAAIIATYLVCGMLRKSFDPFAPVWLFLAGYAQVYVVQAISHRDYALDARGLELVTAANFRALWALVWFLFVYHCGAPRTVSRALPHPPESWSVLLVSAVAPILIAWGLLSAGFEVNSDPNEPMTAEASLVRQFPILMLVAGVLMIVTGRSGPRPRPSWTWIGVGVVALYSMIWMFKGKRSPPLFGVLSAVCAFYVSKGKRPSKAVLAVTALSGALVVTLAIGWRNNKDYEPTLAGFSQYVADFDPSAILLNLNLQTREDEVASKTNAPTNHETEEYGGFLLMLDTVPTKADYDYGLSYLRVVSTYIPRLFWADKPIYGRVEWNRAWMAGSTSKRDEDFTGPAIGLLGATQLNGGAAATAIVLAVLALLTRTAYDYFRMYSTVPWVQAWWALTYFNAWLMTVNDDPFVWFYYIYGHTTLPPMALFWIGNKLAGPSHDAHALNGYVGIEPEGAGDVAFGAASREAHQP